MTRTGDIPADYTLPVVKAGDRGQRLDVYLSKNLPDLSRSRLQRLIEAGQVNVNGQVCFEKNYRLEEEDQISLFIPEPEEPVIEPEEIRLDVIYEDKDLLIINKPRGMVVHPAPGHYSGTMVNALLHYCRDLSGIGGVIRPGIVHRLDKETSGLLIVAKNDFTHRALSEQLKERFLRRHYIALVQGRVKPDKGRIVAPLGRHLRDRKKMAVVSGGREAVTRYRVLKSFGPYTLLYVRLETGRTHQIRVHLSYMGYPVVGDATYAGKTTQQLPAELAFPHALHAYKIVFSHPRSGEKMQFTAPLPEKFKQSLIWLKKTYSQP